METLDKLETISTQKSNSEKRRELRRSLENDTSNPNKFTLNDLMLVGLVLIAMVLSYTDFTLSFGNFKNFTALTLFLYVITTMIYRNRYNRGKSRGRVDTEFCEALQTYRTTRNKVIDQGIVSEIPVFCREYKKKELMEYRTSILADVDMEYDEYITKYRRLTRRDVMKLHLPLDMRNAILRCNEAKPLRLTPGLIMNENGEADREKLLSQSGREREKQDKRRQLVTRGLRVILGCAIVVNLILDFSVITVIQWFIRMMPIMSAIVLADDAGYCSVTVTETNFKRGQTSVIHLFFEYYNKKEKDEGKDIPTEEVIEAEAETPTE